MDDLISRQAAIDALADYIHNVDKVYSTGRLSADDCKDAAKSVLDELPSAQQWIPCSERLPVEGESVLLCDRVGYMILGRLVQTNEGYNWDLVTWSTDIDIWYAWMPLPEPYKGESEDKE